MANDPIPTTLAPFLSVRNGAKAVDFYKSAFGADEIFRHEDPTGAVVSNLAINGYGFWVADESPENKNFSPETLNGGTVRMILTIEDPDAAFDPRHSRRRHRRLPHKDRARLAHRPRPRSLRPPLGDRQATPLLNPVPQLDRNHSRKQVGIANPALNSGPRIHRAKPKVQT
jgi:hypothetical protein